MKTENILYDKKARSKFTNLLNFFTFRSYYELDSMPLKEKMYKFWYNMEKQDLLQKEKWILG